MGFLSKNKDKEDAGGRAAPDRPLPPQLTGTALGRTRRHGQQGKGDVRMRRLRRKLRLRDRAPVPRAPRRSPSTRRGRHQQVIAPGTIQPNTTRRRLLQQPPFSTSYLLPLTSYLYTYLLLSYLPNPASLPVVVLAL